MMFVRSECANIFYNVEFTQEVASKGIGLVYELGDSSIKNSLVESLVSTLTEGRKLAPQSVTPETTLFQEGALGSTPDGSSLSTYQSILSLASDMNQPDLVYKFMSLASHNAIWNSRRGASMGFGSIAAMAERELAPYLPQLIPRLYRFQFDPYVKVADSMKSIWRSLVKEPKKAVDEYFEVIIKDLLKSISDRMWRTREASCAALGDLVHGRSIEQLEPYLQDLWTMCFRALDDIKESVRTVAFSTCKILTNITVKYCDPNVVSITEGQKIMDVVMPFFLTKGLNSMADDVRKFSLSTVLRISKKGGILLKPHITDLVATLLESLTNLEPQVMSYLTFHVDKYNITTEQLDNSRLSVAKSSPMMEAVESSIDNIDAAVLETLAPKLNTIIRKGVGLPTRAGSARFVVSLVTRIPVDLKPHADSLLRALSGAVADRSPAVRKSFATAIGYVTRLCSDTALSKLIQHFKTQYVEAEDDDTRSIPGIALLEMTRRSGDTLSKFHGEVIPLSFVGKRDDVEAIRQTWNEVWEENTAGAASAVKLYLSELMALCVNLLSTSQSWSIKKQVGLAICDMAKAIGSSFTPQMDTALPLLIDSLGGRTWEGKEGVLEALVVVAVEGKDYFKDANKAVKLPDVTKVPKYSLSLKTFTLKLIILQVVIREAKKNNKVYKRYGLEYLGKYMDSLEVNEFEALEDYLKDTAAKEDDDDDMDDVDEARAKPLALTIQANAFKAIGLCWPRDLSTQRKSANVIYA
jgi:proteasome component ECM29